MDRRRVSRMRCAGRTVSESVTPRWLCRHWRRWCCKADLYRETPAAAVEPATTTTTESTARPPSSPSLTSDRITTPIACDAPVSSAWPAGSEALPPIVFYDVQGGTATNTLPSATRRHRLVTQPRITLRTTPSRVSACWILHSFVSRQDVIAKKE